MFLRCKVPRKDGKHHRYWSVVENTRVASGRVVQRHVLYLGVWVRSTIRRNWLGGGRSRFWRMNGLVKKSKLTRELAASDRFQLLDRCLSFDDFDALLFCTGLLARTLNRATLRRCAA